MSLAVRVNYKCKICRKGIGPATARYCGNRKRGFTCIDCQIKDRYNRAQMSSQIEQNYVNDIGQSCQRCYKTLDQIEFETGSRSLWAHRIDGIMAMLCKDCSDWYIPKSGQFKDTWFGFWRGIYQGGNK